MAMGRNSDVAIKSGNRSKKKDLRDGVFMGRVSLSKTEDGRSGDGRGCLSGERRPFAGRYSVNEGGAQGRGVRRVYCITPIPSKKQTGKCLSYFCYADDFEQKLNGGANMTHFFKRHYPIISDNNYRFSGGALIL
jgi:hypothetical protein